MIVKISIISVVALLSGAQLLAQDDHTAKVAIQVYPESIVGRISPDFIGFGYETSAVAQSNYFSANNNTLVRLYRSLSPHGLIRIGGNISDHTRYDPNGVATVQT